MASRHAGEAIECLNPNAAIMKAEALARKPGFVGAIAFSRSGDLATGDFGDAKLIRKFGEVPDDSKHFVYAVACERTTFLIAAVEKASNLCCRGWALRTTFLLKSLDSVKPLS